MLKSLHINMADVGERTVTADTKIVIKDATTVAEPTTQVIMVVPHPLLRAIRRAPQSQVSHHLVMT